MPLILLLILFLTCILFPLIHCMLHCQLQNKAFKKDVPGAQIVPETWVINICTVRITHIKSKQNQGGSSCVATEQFHCLCHVQKVSCGGKKGKTIKKKKRRRRELGATWGPVNRLVLNSNNVGNSKHFIQSERRPQWRGFWWQRGCFPPV